MTDLGSVVTLQVGDDDNVLEPHRAPVALGRLNCEPSRSLTGDSALVVGCRDTPPLVRD